MESNLSSAPALGTITSPSQRRQSHIGINYVDAYNEAQIAKYNNDYNYWLWQQQMSYNTPAAQRKRLEEAGLNPNYQSVDSGNVSTIPSSQGHITPSVGKNTYQGAAVAVNSFNALLDGIKKGVQTTSELSGIPADIQGYRRILRNIAFKDLQSKDFEQMLKMIDAIWQARSKLGISLAGAGWELPDNSSGETYGVSPDWERSPEFQKLLEGVSNLQLKNEDLEWLIKLKEYDLENIKPAEKSVLESRAWLIGEQAGLTRKQNKWFVARVLTEMGSKAAPSLIRMAKLL